MGSYHTYLVMAHSPMLLGEKYSVTADNALKAFNRAFTDTLKRERLYDMLDSEYDTWEPFVSVSLGTQDRWSAVPVICTIWTASFKNLGTYWVKDAMRSVDWEAIGFWRSPPILVACCDDEDDDPKCVDWRDDPPEPKDGDFQAIWIEKK